MASLPKARYKGIEFECLDIPVRILEQLQCAICLELVSEPVSTSCKHLFCGNCIKGLRKCPKCRTKGFKTSPDFVSTGVIEAFKVKCPNSTEGCEWQGELGDAHEHLTKKCKQRQTVCPLGCGEKMKRDLFENHTRDHCPNRPYNCPRCGHSGVYTDVTRSIHYCKPANIAFFPVLFRPWLQNRPIYYHCPPRVVKLEGFDRMKRNNERWVSQPIYSESHFGGYKMCLCVDSNGYDQGKGTHISVYAYLMKGTNDDNLKFPFIGSITVSLLNLEEDGNHHSKDLWEPKYINLEYTSGRVTTGEIAKNGWGYPQFISHEDLGYNSAKNTAYLKSDSLFFRVEKFEPVL